LELPHPKAKLGKKNLLKDSCMLKGAIARENALLLLKPFKVVDECCEFE